MTASITNILAHLKNSHKKPSNHIFQAVVIILLTSCLAPQWLTAQCTDDSEILITINLTTGNFGGDTRWELRDDDTGESYGSHSIYPNHSMFEEQVCVPLGANLTFAITCCFNNDGSYCVKIGDFVVVERAVFQLDELTSFVAAPPIALQADITQLDLQNHVLTGANPIIGQLRNAGTDTLQTIELSYQINEQTVQTAIWENANIAPAATFHFEHPIKWQASQGQHQVSIWVSQLNGVVMENTDNEALNQLITASSSLSQRMVLVEAFTNASCTACALADPNFATIATGLSQDVAAISYHTSFPGFDPMYLDNPTDVDARVDFYDIPGVPRTIAEGGLFAGSTGSFTSADVARFQQMPALFKIGVSEKELTDGCIRIDVRTQSHVSDLLMENNNLRLFIVLAEEKLLFLAPPGSNGLTDFYYVMRKMLPDVDGFPMVSPENNLEEQVWTVFYERPEFVQPSQLRTFVFVQDAINHTVYQAFRSDMPTGQARTSSREMVSLNHPSQAAYLSIKRQPPTCWQAEDGAIEVEVVGGISPYQFHWSNGETAANLVNIAAGNYQISITDANGLLGEADINLLESNNLQIEIQTTDDVNSASNGSATIDITGATANDNFSYLWSNGQTSKTIHQLSAGDYAVTIHHLTGGCSYELETTIRGMATHIETITNDKLIQLYPNPTQGKLYCQQKIEKVQIFDVLGKIVFTQTTVHPTLPIDVSHLLSGVYLVQWQIDKKLFMQKIIFSF